MSKTQLTITEFAKMGREAVNQKYSPQERQKWASKGGLTVMWNRGKDHYKKMNQLSQEAKRKRKLEKEAAQGT